MILLFICKIVIITKMKTNIIFQKTNFENERLEIKTRILIELKN